MYVHDTTKSCSPLSLPSSLHSGPPSPNRAANKSTCSNQCIDHPGEGPYRAINTLSLVFTVMSEKAVMMVSFSQVWNEREREREQWASVSTSS